MGANAGRALLLSASLAVATVMWLGLGALAAPTGKHNIPTLGLLTVSNAGDTGTELPLSYAATIRALPEVASVHYLNFLPLLCAPRVTATLNGLGGDVASMVATDYAADAVALSAWDHDPMGLLVGSRLAERCGWTLGMHPSPKDGFRERDTEVHIVGILPRSSDTYNDQIALAHYEYLNRLSDPAQQNRVASIGVVAQDPSAAAALALKIDKLFAAADPPTETEENATAISALDRFGNIQLLLRWIVIAAFACAGLVFVSVMAHAAANRIPDMAVLSVLGFPRRFLLACLALESAFLIAFGLALGALAIWLITPFLEAMIAPITGAFSVPLSAYLTLPWLFIGLLILSAWLPFVAVFRLRPIDYSR